MDNIEVIKKEKALRQINTVVVLMAASVAILAAQSDPPSRVGRFNYMQGPASFQPAGMNDWVDATINRPLIPGDNIWVGDRGRAELHVGSTVLRIGANTAFEFLNLDDQTVQVRLSEGTLTVRIRNLAQGQVYEVDTPNLAFTLLRPGEYRIDADPDSQTTTVTVRAGEGDVTGGGQGFPVYARQRVVVRGDDPITFSLTALPGADAWDQWCSSRDRREDQSLSARYVSREMAGYEDLDQYGRWDNQPGYGQVWMPTTVSAGWAPYHDGEWAWIAPWGWTWVDDAPWGFAPYHYGRWANFRGRWGWVPGPYGVTPVYAPALVAWVGGRGGSGFSLSFSIGTAAAIGWFPLGPREPYFPSYQVSQGYFTRVNNTNTVINNTTINNYYDYSRNSNNTAITNIQYANRNVQNGVTAVPQDTFARGRRVTQDSRPVPAAQMTAAQVYGTPTIAPQRESVLGAKAGTASRAVRPSANIMNRPVVARTAPPPAPVPFDRQQPALARNPGRPLPAATVQQMRQATPVSNQPVRVVDPGRVRRVQPAIDGGVRGGPPKNPVVPPPVSERKSFPPGQQQRDVQQQQRQQQDAERQQKQRQDVQQQQKQQQDAQQQQRQQQDAERQQKQRQDVQQQQKQQQDVQQQQRQQQDAERQQKQRQDVQQQQKQQQDAQQQQRQQQDAERQQKQRQDVQQQQRQQQDAERQQKQRQDAQQQQKQQQDAQQQQRQQQDAERQQKQRQDAQQQQKQQQDAQQQQRQQQDAERQQKQRQDAQQQQKQQQDAQQQQKQQQDAQQQQKQRQDLQQQQKQQQDVQQQQRQQQDAQRQQKQQQDAQQQQKQQQDAERQQKERQDAGRQQKGKQQKSTGDENNRKKENR